MTAGVDTAAGLKDISRVMAWIARRSVKARGLAVGLAALAIVLGVVQLRGMPRDVLPEFQPPTVEVQTQALGLSAAEVEQLLTVSSR